MEHVGSATGRQSRKREALNRSGIVSKESEDAVAAGLDWLARHQLPDGIRFYHFVQSFKIGEAISPQEANEIGMELAKIFENREVIVATHIDKDHLHNHIVVCSYDLESGLKLHYNQFFLSSLFCRKSERKN